MSPIRIALVSALLGCNLGAQVPAPSAPPADSFDILGHMATLIAPCVRPTTTQRVFTRCYDTHSSIHAHWAAYRLARIDPQFAPLAFTSYLALTPTKLGFEFNYMRYPYAAAWFLRLAVEYESLARTYGAPDPLRLRTTGDKVAAWLKSYYDTRGVNPYLADYSNPAWALYQLHSYYTYTKKQSLADQVSATIRKHFVVAIQNLSFGAELRSRAFFSTFGNWIYVVARTQSAATFKRFLALQKAIPDAHLVPNTVTSVHSYGLVWSRMWALRALAQAAPSASDRARYRRAAAAHLAAGMVRHWKYKGNFAQYDHWVPQFAVYAATEGL